MLYDKDGYCFGWQGPINWTPSELRPPDESVRNYDYLQAIIGQRTKTVTFFVDGSDKAVVALRSELEKTLTKMGEAAWRSFLRGDWLAKSGGDYDEQVESVNKELLRIVGKHFKVEVVGKQRIAELSEKKNQNKRQ